MTAEPGAATIDCVVKLGGALLHDPALHERALRACSMLARDSPLLLVPGGGPFADVVRELDRRLSLGDDLSHWLAIRTMDLHAELIVGRAPGACLVSHAADIGVATGGELLVLAPFAWLRATDPLPHSWEVTSDSIAAWVARALDARRLLLVKRTAGRPELLTDGFFPQARGSLAVDVVTVDVLEQLARGG